MRRLPKTGFTLIELMIAASILAILAMIALPKFSNLIVKAQEAAVKGKLGSLRSALTLYGANMEGVFPQYLRPLTEGGVYLDKLPVIQKLPRYPDHIGGGPDTAAASILLVPVDCTNFIKGGIQWQLYVTGSVYVNCTHADSRGSIWSTW
jgi:prepilin-type N-terminal cleavage/methylation domain-containing protein